MKINLDYQIKRLLRENLLYIVAFFTLVLILFFVVFLYVNQYNENVKKINSLEAEIEEYNKKRELLDFKNQVVSNEVDLDYVNGVLTQLIPTKEDYFSVIAALENLSVQTNFIITSYNIIVGSSTPEKLAIIIEGQGDPNTFLEFLKEYNFAGGRLITADKIEFTQEAFTGAKVNISVYAGKPSSTKVSKTIEEDNTTLIETLLQKVKIDLKTEEFEVSEYPTKSNPF